jgi:hypothetical protein
MKISLLTAFAGAILSWNSMCLAQEEENAGPLFAVINTVPKSGGFQCYIANAKTTNMLTPAGEAADEAPGNGFCTGLLRWQPVDGELVAKLPGKTAITLKPFIKPGETPILILKEKSTGQAGFSLLPKAESRDTAFYDAINLTSQAELQVAIDGKKVILPKGNRVRVSKNNNVRYEVTDGPNDTLESADPPSHLMIFYGDDSGNIRCMVVADYAA